MTTSKAPSGYGRLSMSPTVHTSCGQPRPAAAACMRSMTTGLMSRLVMSRMPSRHRSNASAELPHPRIRTRSLGRRWGNSRCRNCSYPCKCPALPVHNSTHSRQIEPCSKQACCEHGGYLEPFVRLLVLEASVPVCGSQVVGIAFGQSAALAAALQCSGQQSLHRDSPFAGDVPACTACSWQQPALEAGSHSACTEHGHEGLPMHHDQRGSRASSCDHTRAAQSVTSNQAA